MDFSSNLARQKKKKKVGDDDGFLIIGQLEKVTNRNIMPPPNLYIYPLSIAWK